jgi:hypothetical protein
MNVSCTGTGTPPAVSLHHETHHSNKEQAMKKRTDIGQRYWVVTVGLLMVELSGWRIGLYAALVLTVVQLVHFAWLESSLTSFSLQVRIAYLGLLILGFWTPLQCIHWIQLIGTSARVLVGYCLLARMLSLLPWNRFQPLSWALFNRTFLSASGEVGCGKRYIYDTAG